MPEMTLPCQRDLFEIPKEVAYFNCAYLSPLMRAVREAGYRGVDRKRSPWQVLPNDFFDESESARRLFAQLIGAQSDDVALIPAVSYGAAIVMANLRLNAGDEIVLLDEQFPSNVYPWLEVAKKTGSNLAFAKRQTGEGWTESVLREIRPTTKLLSIPNVHWTDGRLLQLPRISRACREVGAKLVLDVTQSLGAVPFDIEAVQPDFVMCAGYKWLLGPYSLGYLYVSPEFQDGVPVEHNWINRRDSEDFSGLVNYVDDFQPGARRFDVGERSNFALLPMAVAALQQIQEWRVAKINASLDALCEKIATAALAMGLDVTPANERAGHMLGLRFPKGPPDGLLDRLKQQNVYVSLRGDSMRVAPHLYNNDADIARLATAVQELL